MKRPISGWVILDKPAGLTSTKAVGRVRWLFAAEKAGHAGTLDPLATGILPIALGDATKTVPYVQDGEKVYRFTVKWGEATSTDDAEGPVIATSDHRPDAAAIAAVLPAFTGAIAQLPPAFSALKIDGERAYDLARAGQTVTLAPRTVEIAALTLLAHHGETTELEARCGKGTYVRALARDLGEVLGTKAHVSALRRSAVGGFGEAEATTLEALEALEPAERDALLAPLSAALRAVPELRLTAQQVTAIRNGNPVLLTGAAAPAALAEAWASFRGDAVAIGSVERGHFQPRRVLG